MVQPDQIIRSRRKTVSLEINDSGQLIVRAPNNLVIDEIYKIIARHQKWILRKQAEIEKKLAFLRERNFSHGSKMLYRGEWHPIQIAPSQSSALLFTDGVFLLSEQYQSSARDVFRIWYKRKTKEYIQRHLPYFAQVLQVFPQRVRITFAQKRWGSCSNQGNINFSYRLSMVPDWVFNYVIIHELAHLKEPNHSPAFWSLIQKVMPYYKESKKWLKEHHLYTIL